MSKVISEPRSLPEAHGSRQRMIEAAIDLMRGSGLSGAGINEIVRASGAPKGSVYHHFPAGKQQIVAEALSDYSGRVMAFIDGALASRDEDLDGLRGLIADAFDDWARLIARHFDLGDARRTRSFAGLVLTAIEGAYVRARAEQSSRPFVEAGAWLAELVSPVGPLAQTPR
jgi:TetR/AcrR family transcriptional regulator, lmrAB and yxaGH operons repressor